MEAALIDLIRRTSPEDVCSLLIAGGVMLVALIISLTYMCLRHRRSETILQLKAEMVSRGMSAAEIERVLDTKPSLSETDRLWHQGMSAKDIERVLAAKNKQSADATASTSAS
jgi:hypothetical protein